MGQMVQHCTIFARGRHRSARRPARSSSRDGPDGTTLYHLRSCAGSFRLAAGAIELARCARWYNPVPSPPAGTDHSGRRSSRFCPPARAVLPRGTRRSPPGPCFARGLALARRQLASRLPAGAVALTSKDRHARQQASPRLLAGATPPAGPRARARWHAPSNSPAPAGTRRRPRNRVVRRRPEAPGATASYNTAIAPRRMEGLPCASRPTPSTAAACWMR